MRQQTSYGRVRYRVQQGEIIREIFTSMAFGLAA
jgi:hypothetical protein